METHITVCKTANGNVLCGSGNSNRGSAPTERGGMGWEMGERLKREVIYV